MHEEEETCRTKSIIHADSCRGGQKLVISLLLSLSQAGLSSDHQSVPSVHNRSQTHRTTHSWKDALLLFQCFIHSITRGGAPCKALPSDKVRPLFDMPPPC